MLIYSLREAMDYGVFLIPFPTLKIWILLTESYSRFKIDEIRNNPDFENSHFRTSGIILFKIY